VLLPLALALALATAAAPSAAAAGEVVLELFTRSGCPHCENARRYLDALTARHPELRVVEHDVARDATALARLEALSERAGIGPAGVPSFVVGDAILVGFDGPEGSGRRLEELLFGAVARAGGASADEERVHLPLLGAVSARELGLPLFTVALGLLDGFNPCATWALLFLLSLLVHLRSRARMLAVGGTFVAVSGIVYFAFMAAWLNLFLWVGLADPLRILVACIAMGMGAVHLKDAVLPGRGPSLSIPGAARPGIYARVRRVLHAEDLSGAVAATALLACFVNAVELLCTAGLPALYTRVLTLVERPWWSHYGYLALYNLAYVFDDALLLAAAVAGLGGLRLQERGARGLQALSGSLLLGLGALLLLRPGWLR
jgi:glutaredoxin